jgi:hypothetical protein
MHSNLSRQLTNSNDFKNLAMDSSLIKWVKTFDEAANINSLGDLADGTIIHRYFGSCKRVLSYSLDCLISHDPAFFATSPQISFRTER